jgi:hypothetical protein
MGPCTACSRGMSARSALRAVATRTTEGRFDNGRGLRVPFRILEKAPKKRVTILDDEDLQDLARDADLLRPLHLEFDRVMQLLVREDLQVDAGRNSSRFFEDYREVDGVKVPFRLRFTASGADVAYTVERVRVNRTIDDRLFQHP